MTFDSTSPDALEPRAAQADSALVARAATGDREAFDELVILHERAAMRAAVAALGSRDEAADAVQDAFLQAWRSLPRFRGASTFRTWILTIVWRGARARRRARQRWWQRIVPAGGSPPDAGGFALSWASDEPDPERRALDRDRAGRTATTIARLSPKLRDTLLLAASGEYTYEEIGGMLGVATGTIKWRVSEARRLVRRAFEDGHES